MSHYVCGMIDTACNIRSVIDQTKQISAGTTDFKKKKKIDMYFFSYAR